jgi:hypothetical protein
VADAASRVWNLHRVLVWRNDAVSRRNFLDVVANKSVLEARVCQRSLRGQNNGWSREWVLHPSGLNGFSLFSPFWVQICIGLEGRIQRLLKYMVEVVWKVMWPRCILRCVRLRASLEMVTELYDMMQMGLSSSEDVAAFFSSSGEGSAAAGFMGGSACLEESVFLYTVGLRR